MTPLIAFAVALSSSTPSDSRRMAARIEPERPAIVRKIESPVKGEDADRRHVHVDIIFDDRQSTWK